MAKGFQDESRPGRDWGRQGLHFAWACLGLALVSPDKVRAELPRTSGAKLSSFFEANPQLRALSPTAIRAWVPYAWKGLGFGTTAGILSWDEGRVRAVGRLDAPVNQNLIDLRRRTVSLGKLFGKEGSDRRIGLTVGVEMVQ